MCTGLAAIPFLITSRFATMFQFCLRYSVFHKAPQAANFLLCRAAKFLKARGHVAKALEIAQDADY
jgi:hypothetical protein